jgi:hypothetical protein
MGGPESTRFVVTTPSRRTGGSTPQVCGRWSRYSSVRRFAAERLIAIALTTMCMILSAACASSVAKQVPLDSGNQGYLLDTPSVLMYVTFDKVTPSAVTGAVQQIIDYSGPGRPGELSGRFVGTRVGNQITIRSAGPGSDAAVGSGGVFLVAPGLITTRPEAKGPQLKFRQTTSIDFQHRVNAFVVQHTT